MTKPMVGQPVGRVQGFYVKLSAKLPHMLRTKATSWSPPAARR